MYAKRYICWKRASGALHACWSLMIYLYRVCTSTHSFDLCNASKLGSSRSLLHFSLQIVSPHLTRCVSLLLLSWNFFFYLHFPAISWMKLREISPLTHEATRKHRWFFIAFQSRSLFVTLVYSSLLLNSAVLRAHQSASVCGAKRRSSRRMKKKKLNDLDYHNKSGFSYFLLPEFTFFFFLLAFFFFLQSLFNSFWWV